MKRIALAIALGIVLTSPINSYATDNNAEYWYPTYRLDEKIEKKEYFDNNYKKSDELVDLLSEYMELTGIEKGKITDVWLEESGDGYSQYSWQYKDNDVAHIASYVSETPYFTLDELYNISGLSEEDVEIEFHEEELLSYSTHDGYIHTGEYIVKTTFLFNSDNHGKNLSAFMKVKEEVEEKYPFKFWNFNTNDGGSVSHQRFNWNEVYLIDEFGFETQISEEYTEKQVNALNEELKQKNYKVTCNPDTYEMIYDTSLTETEIIELAMKLYKEYGLYANITVPIEFWGKIQEDYTYLIGLDISEITNVKGDLSGNGYAWKEDLRYYSNWILAKYPPEAVYAMFHNINNADLNEDGVVDEFDVALLRQRCK